MPGLDAGRDAGYRRGDSGEGTSDAASPDDTGPPQDAASYEDGGHGDGGPLPTARSLPTQGSAIVLTSDDSIAVAANRQANTISVFAFVAGLTPVLTRTADPPVADAEPWQAVIGNDDDTAYVILRRRQQVVRIDDLDGKPAIASAPAATGSEPTGLAISPTGRTLYVANWADGTITVVDAATMTATSTIDLNAALVETGALGPGVIARPGLAHPRAIVVTNDGDSDDSDETLYVTEYFGQARTDALPAGPERFDVQKRGIVYALEVATPAAVRTIDLAPISDTGFVDSAGNTTGCYPNQLQTIALDGTRLYVGSLCASPRGPTGPVLNPDGTLRNPANFRTQVHTTIHAIDTMSDTELTSGRVQLTRAFQEDYLAACMTPPAPGNPACTADDASRRFPLIATDLQFLPGGGVAYLTAYGSDAVFRVRYAADGTLAEVGSSAANFIPLAPGGAVPSGQLPLGIAIARGATPQALVLNEATRNVSVISFATQAAISRVFWTPGEGANHPVTGSLRTSTYTAGAAFPAAVNPPSAGVGRTATLRFPAGPSAGADDQIQCILRAVGTFPSSGTTPIGPEGIVASEVRADMSSTAQGASGYNPPALLGLATGAPHYHAGNARTLEEAFSSFFDRHHTAFSVNFLVTGDRPTQVRQLVSFLLSIDEDTTPVAIPSASALGYQPELCPGRL